LSLCPRERGYEGGKVWERRKIVATLSNSPMPAYELAALKLKLGTEAEGGKP